MAQIRTPPNLGSIQQSFDGKVKGLRQKMFEGVFGGLLDVRNTVLSPGYVPKKTGDLARSIIPRMEPGSPAKRVTGIIGTNKVYAGIQEFGGTINAKNSKYLTFKVNGRWVRVRQVTIRPKRYFTRAIKENEKKIEERFRKLMAIKDLTR